MLASAREGGGGREWLALERGGEEEEEGEEREGMEGREGVEAEMEVGEGFLFREKKDEGPLPPPPPPSD